MVIVWSQVINFILKVQKIWDEKIEETAFDDTCSHKAHTQRILIFTFYYEKLFALITMRNGTKAFDV